MFSLTETTERAHCTASPVPEHRQDHPRQQYGELAPPARPECSDTIFHTIANTEQSHSSRHAGYEIHCRSFVPRRIRVQCKWASVYCSDCSESFVLSKAALYIRPKVICHESSRRFSVIRQSDYISDRFRQQQIPAKNDACVRSSEIPGRLELCHTTADQRSDESYSVRTKPNLTHAQRPLKARTVQCVVCQGSVIHSTPLSVCLCLTRCNAQSGSFKVTPNQKSAR